MKYLSVVAVFCLIAIVAAGTHDESLLPNTLNRLRRQTGGFQSVSSSSSSSSSSTGTNGGPIHYHQESSSYQSGGPVAPLGSAGVSGINLADRFGEDGPSSSTGGFATGHHTSVSGVYNPATGQNQIYHQQFQQYPQYPYNTQQNYQQNN